MRVKHINTIVLLIIILATCETPPAPQVDPLAGAWVLVQGDLNYKGIAGFIIEKSDQQYFITLGEHQKQGFVAQGNPRPLTRQADIYRVGGPDLFNMEITIIDTGLEVRITTIDNNERIYLYQRKNP
ncbi:MAG: hypothetical protein JXR70_17440 [Spirochaetales bacterium]|nr:hypothetical protein [Spirochaetales bacterium]